MTKRAEYKKIVSKISIPANHKIKQKAYLQSGTLPVIDQGQELVGGYTNDCQKQIVCDLPVIVFGDHTKNVKYINFPFCAGADGIKILKAKDDIFPKYLYYGTKFLTFCIEDKGYARHYQHIEKQELSVPPLPEQERIVAKIEELFSQLDAAVAELKSVKEKLAIYRQAVLKEAFEGKLTERWRTNNPDSNAESILSKIFQRKAKQPRSKTYSLQEDINLCELPDEWKWMFIGDITDAPEYGTSQKSLATGKVPVIRMGNLQKGIIDWSDLAFTNDENDISKYRLHQGDVLFNRTNSPELVGKTSIFQGERDAIFAGYLIRINHYEFINSRYLNHYMNSFVAKNYGSKVKTDGVNQSNINGQKMCSYPFPLCSEEEQEQVVYELEERLSTFDSIEQTVDIALQQAAALRQSILKQAFEGNL